MELLLAKNSHTHPQFFPLSGWDGLKKAKTKQPVGKPVIEKEWFGMQIAYLAYLTLTEWLLGVMCPTVRKAVSSQS